MCSGGCGIFCGLSFGGSLQEGDAEGVNQQVKEQVKDGYKDQRLTAEHGGGQRDADKADISEDCQHLVGVVKAFRYTEYIGE